MYKRLNKYIIILFTIIISITFVNTIDVQAFGEKNSIIKDNDKLEYKILDDGFDNSFFGGLIERVKLVLSNSNNKVITGILYQDTSIDKVSVDGVGFTTEELKKNPEPLRQLFLSEDKKDGLEHINISTKEYETYSYEEYLELVMDNAQPINIATNTTWTKDKGPYYVAGEIRVLNGAKLTIEAGTTIYFTNTPINNSKSGILVDGELVIKGTASDNVKLIPLNDNNENKVWKGIYVSERGTLKASYAEIDKAGSWSDSAVYSLGNLELDNCIIKNTDGNGISAFTDAKITNCTISNNSNYGIDLYRYNNDYKTIVTNNKITSNNMAGRIVIRQTTSSIYDVKDNIVSNNQLNGFKLNADILGNITFTKPGSNVPYILVNHGDKFSNTEQFIVNKNSSVTFDKTIVKIEDNNGSYDKNKIIVDGTLNIIGTATDNAIFTSLNNHSVLGDTASLGNVIPEVNDWDGIYVNEGGKVNIEYGDLSYASNVVSSFGQVTINNSKFSDSFMGVYTYNNKASIENSKFSRFEKLAFNYTAMNQAAEFILKNNSFSNIEGRIGKVYLYKSGGKNLELSGNTSINNKRNGVEFSGDLSLDTNIKNIGNDIPYIIPMLRVSDNTVLSVDEGTILKVEDGVFFGEKTCIDIYGRLLINGTEKDSVIITSLKDDTIGGDSNGDSDLTSAENGDWGAINIFTSRNLNSASIFNYADIRFGGDNQREYMLGGSGSLVVNNSIIRASSQDGIRVTGDLVLNSSKIIDNDKIGVHAKSNNSFDVNLDSNKFENNKEFAAFITFGSSNDKFVGSNNTGVNNEINGVGLSGVLSSDFTLSPAGNNFPFVVPEELTVMNPSTLTITEGVITKFGKDARLTLSGSLDINGSVSSKVSFISLNDDSLGGDTNNNGNATKNEYADWQGIIYSDGSEGFFDEFECLDPKYNMDYDNVPYVKAISKADDNVSIYEDRSVFVKSESNDISSIVLYNYTNGVETIVKSNSNRKTSPMIYGNHIAWIEGGNIGLYNISSGSQQYISASGVSSIYLNDGYLVWSSNSSLTYRNLSTGSEQKIINTVDESFSPVISSRYLIYKSNEDGMYHRITLSNKEDYYMLSNKSNHINADMYGDNLLMLSNDPRLSVKNIIVGDIPSWTAVEVTDNISNSNNHAAIYKDKVIFYNSGEEKIIIRETNENNEVRNLSVLTRGYNVYGDDIGKSNSIFTDKDLIYILKTKFNTNKDKFVNGNRATTNGYDRKITLSKGTGIKIGCQVSVKELEKDAVEASAAIGFTVSQNNDLSYVLKKNTTDANIEMGVGRKKLLSAKLDSKLGLKVGLGNIANVSIGSTAAVGRSILDSDEYYFDTNTSDGYKNIGILTAANLIDSSQSILNPLDYVIKQIIENSLKDIVDPENSSLRYDAGTGLGVDTSLGATAGISSGIIDLGANLSINTNTIAKIGKSNNGKYVALDSGYKSTFLTTLKLPIYDSKTTIHDSKTTIHDEKDKVKIKAEAKLPITLYSNTLSEIKFSFKLEEGNKLTISISDNSKDENGYISTHKFIIQGSNYDYIKAAGLFGEVKELEMNLRAIDNDMLLASYSLSSKESLYNNVHDLLTLINNASNLQYEISISKGILRNLSLPIDTSIVADRFPGIKPTGGILVSGGYSDNISLTIDKGIISKGVVVDQDVKIAFIPVEDESAMEILGNSLAAFASQINPIKSKYKDGIATLNDEGRVKATIKASDLYRASFIQTPIGKDGIFELDENNIILGEGIYIESMDNNKDVISYYPEGSELTLYVDSANWNAYKGKKFAIYEYDTNKREWIKLGGKINNDNGSITVPIKRNSQYAIGVDKSSPDIIWRNVNGSELYNNNTYYMNDGDVVNIEVIDNDVRHNNKVIVKEGDSIVNEYYTSSNNIDHTVRGEKGNKYEIILDHYDEFENNYKEIIKVVIN